MKYALFFLLLASLSGCSTIRQLEKARATVARFDPPPEPEKQYEQLVTAHPNLLKRQEQVVVVHDTIWREGRMVKVFLPPAPLPPPPNNTLLDSLMRSASAQVHRNDSATVIARLRALLAARPKISRDTLRQTFGTYQLRTWIDRHGQPHTSVTSLPAQKVLAVLTKTVPAGPPAPAPAPPAPPANLLPPDELDWRLCVAVLVAGLLLYFFLRPKNPPTA